MKDLDSACGICGKSYKVCKTCRDTKMWYSWRTVCDTPEHYAIFLVLNAYTNKEITKDDAKARLEKMNLEGYESFIPGVVAEINEILGKTVQSVTVTDANEQL